MLNIKKKNWKVAFVDQLILYLAILILRVGLQRLFYVMEVRVYKDEDYRTIFCVEKNVFRDA